MKKFLNMPLSEYAVMVCGALRHVSIILIEIRELSTDTGSSIVRRLTQTRRSRHGCEETGARFRVEAFCTAPTLIEAERAELVTLMFSVCSVRLSAK